MAAPPVRIRIGGSIDASLDRALQSAVQKTAQAEKAIQREKRRSTSAAEQEAAKQLKAQERLTRAVEALDRQRSRALFQQFRAQEAASERAARMQERSVARAHAAERREIEKTARTAAKAIADEQRKRESAERQALRKAVRGGESFARRTSHRASRFLAPEAPIGSMAMRALGGAARGAGIDFSVQGAVGRSVGMESLANDISNTGFQAGAQGANGQRQDPRAIIAQARGISSELGIDAMDVLAGIDRFKNISGDLATSRAMIGDLARLASATGTSLDDMAAAAANVSNGLGDIPDKARIIDEVMRTVAGQGQLGAVEISDMAVQMARVAAAASAFSGDRGTNIAKMGALAQVARAEGGAPSAAESARSVVGFASTMKKTARINAFKKEGIDVFEKGSGGTKLRDPIELIKESLLATGGNLQDMNKLFMDVIGARAVTGLQKTFVGAGGGGAGIQAVEAQVSRLLKAQLSKEQVKDSAAIKSEETKAKAARFQNALDGVTSGVMDKLVPALERSSGDIIRFAEVVGNIATWAITNPKTAIATAITASIARAGVESAFRSGIERLFVGPDGSRASKLGSVVGTVGALGTIAALSATTLTVGIAIIDNAFIKAQQEQKEAVEKDIAAVNAGNEALGLAKQGDLTGAKTKAEEAVKLKEQALAQTQATAPGFWGKVLEKNIGGDFIDYEAFKTRDQAIAKATERQQQELVQSRAVLQQILEAIQAAPPGAGPPPGGRSSN